MLKSNLIFSLHLVHMLTYQSTYGKNLLHTKKTEHVMELICNRDYTYNQHMGIIKDKLW